MMYSVTGAGPRVGTGWVMGKLHEAGLPVYWTKNLIVEGSSYDTHWNELPGLNNVIAKVWPPFLSKVDVSKMIVLRRNRKDQIASTIKQIRRERKAGFTVNDTPEQLIDRCEWFLKQQHIPTMEVRTEDLDDNIDKIIEWLSEPFELQRTG